MLTTVALLPCAAVRSTIAANLPGRIGKQCRERWHNHLNPDIRKDAWTQEEDDVILQAHKTMGNRWSHTQRSTHELTHSVSASHVSTAHVSLIRSSVCWAASLALCRPAMHWSRLLNARTGRR